MTEHDGAVQKRVRAWRGRPWRALRVGAVSIAVGMAALGAAAPSASAATQCSGSQIDSGKSDQGYGTWHLYWNGSTGKNCVRMDVTGRGVGHTRYMYLSIQACGSTKESSCGTPVVNQGQFHTYSGPVSVTAPHCVQIHYENSIDYGSGLQDADTIGPYH